MIPNASSISDIIILASDIITFAYVESGGTPQNYCCYLPKNGNMELFSRLVLHGKNAFRGAKLELELVKAAILCTHSCKEAPLTPMEFTSEWTYCT